MTKRRIYDIMYMIKYNKLGLYNYVCAGLLTFLQMQFMQGRIFYAEIISQIKMFFTKARGESCEERHDFPGCGKRKGASSWGGFFEQ